MKLRVLLYAAALVTGLRSAVAADDPLRAIEVAELHRTVDPALVAALDGPPPLAGRAALALGRTKRAEGAGPLRAHLTVADPGVRALVVYGLGLLGDVGSLDFILGSSARDGNSAVRYAAVDAIGRIVLAVPGAGGRDVALGVLGVARRDADPIVRAHAAAQLDVFASAAFAPQIVRGLEDSVQRDPVADVRQHAAWAVYRRYAKVADAGFLRRAVRDRDELVRVEALRAWGRRADAGAAAVVRPLLSDRSWRVQLEAGEALRRLAKQPPTEHLTADPPGLHLPIIPKPSSSSSLPAVMSAVAPSTPATMPPMGASPGEPSSPGSPEPKPAAPDPATLPLEARARLPVSAAEMNAAASGPHPRVSIVTTKGELIVRLYPEWAPSTVANFIALAERGYFNGNRWFRIVPDFVVQTGDKNDNADGDPGFSIPAEENPIEQRSGIISMGLDYEGSHAKRDSAGSQFYITLSPQLHLDRDFTVFGEVQSGFAVLAHLVESDRMTVVRRIADQ